VECRRELVAVFFVLISAFFLISFLEFQRDALQPPAGSPGPELLRVSIRASSSELYFTQSPRRCGVRTDVGIKAICRDKCCKPKSCKFRAAYLIPFPETSCGAREVLKVDNNECGAKWACTSDDCCTTLTCGNCGSAGKALTESKIQFDCGRESVTKVTATALPCEKPTADQKSSVSLVVVLLFFNVAEAVLPLVFVPHEPHLQDLECLVSLQAEGSASRKTARA